MTGQAPHHRARPVPHRSTTAGHGHRRLDEGGELGIGDGVARDIKGGKRQFVLGLFVVIGFFIVVGSKPKRASGYLAPGEVGHLSLRTYSVSWVAQTGQRLALPWPGGPEERQGESDR